MHVKIYEVENNTLERKCLAADSQSIPSLYLVTFLGIKKADNPIESLLVNILTSDLLAFCAQVLIYKDNWVITLWSQCYWKKNLMLLPFPIETRDMAHHTDPQEKHQVLVRKQKQKWGKTHVFTGVSTRKAKQDRVNSLGLGGLNKVGWLWATRVVSSCLGPGLGIIKTESYCLLGYMSQLEEEWIWID